MVTPGGINVNRLVSDTENYASQGKIDPVENIRSQRNYIFAGTLDNTVNPNVGKKLEEYLLRFQNESNLLTEFDIGAGHAHITDFYGNGCTTSRAPYINNCDYDAPGIILQHMSKEPLKPRGEYISNNLIKFRQEGEFSAPSFQRNGYVYVPTGCQRGEECGIHVAFHGCTMNSENLQVRDQYVEHSGYNQWGESNNIIILYPQVSSSFLPLNPNACFDWWGYTNRDFATKEGPQMKAVKAMIDKLMSGGPPIPPPSSLKLVSVTDNTVSFSWEPVAEAQGYLVSRDGSIITPDPIPSTLFNDTALSSGTTYEYTVTSVSPEGYTSSPSEPLDVKTTGPPPPLTAPSLSLVSTSSDSVSISWSNVPGAEGYTILRDGLEIATTPSISTEYQDSGLEAETTYTYLVRAFNSESVGPDSNPVQATTESGWICETYFDNNFSHVSAGRAYQVLGLVYAQGSDQFMGLYNIGAYRRLSETSQGYFELGACPDLF